MPRFEEGDTVILEKSATVPDAKVVGVRDDLYELEWSNGNVNERRIDEIDAVAINAHPRYVAKSKTVAASESLMIPDDAIGISTSVLSPEILAVTYLVPTDE